MLVLVVFVLLVLVLLVMLLGVDVGNVLLEALVLLDVLGVLGQLGVLMFLLSLVGAALILYLYLVPVDRGSRSTECLGPYIVLQHLLAGTKTKRYQAYSLLATTRAAR